MNISIIDFWDKKISNVIISHQVSDFNRITLMIILLRNNY